MAASVLWAAGCEPHGSERFRLTSRGRIPGRPSSHSPNPKTNSWSRVASLPTPRADLQAVTGPDGRIYAVGGGAGNKCLSSPCDVVEAYSVRRNAWTAADPLPHPRWLFAAVAGPDGRIYVAGGCGDGSGRLLRQSHETDTEVSPGSFSTRRARLPLARRVRAAECGSDSIGMKDGSEHGEKGHPADRGSLVPSLVHVAGRDRCREVTMHAG